MIDSLPEDTEEIDVSRKGLTSLDVTRFKKLKILYCSNNQLTSLHFNENLEKLYCNNNKLTSLLTKNLKILYCERNQLTSLLTKKLRVLCCSNNQLTSLILNENLLGLYCSYNKLTCLHLNANLHTLYCYNNKLSSLYLNENLQELSCSNNQLTSLHLNEKLVTINYRDNPIYEIINTNDKQIIKQKLRVLNRFRYLYYCLKYKKRFRDWLWVKIREPKIRERYSHDYLLENLHEDTDLDEFLEKW
jgi:Leucine-rich repeat (LRR) protein